MPMLVLLPRRPRTPIATRCNLIRITMSSTSIHTNKFGVPLGFMTQPRTELHLPLQRTSISLGSAIDRHGQKVTAQILSFIVVLRTNKFHSELLLLFCLFHLATAHSAYMGEKNRQKDNSNTSLGTYQL